MEHSIVSLKPDTPASRLRRKFCQTPQRIITGRAALFFALLIFSCGFLRIQTTRAASVTTTFQQGANGYISGQDNELDAQEPTSTYSEGGLSYPDKEALRYCSTSVCTEILIRFPDLNILGTVTDVTLTINQADAQSSASSSIFVFEPTENWDTDSVTWDDYSAGNAWAMPGGDFGAAIGSASDTASKGPGSVVIDFGTNISLSGIETNGLLLTTDLPGYNYQWFYSNEYATTSSRPLLTVTYTPSLPSAPTGLAAVAASSSSSGIDLSWNSSPGASYYDIYRCTGSCTPTSTIATTTLTSYADTGLIASTTYTYAVDAGNAAGTSTLSGAVTATTRPPDTTPPSISWISPSSDGSIVSSTATLTVSSTDNIAVRNVSFYRGSVATSTLIGSSTTASGTLYSISWNTASLANGSTTLIALAEDTNDNTSTADIVANVENPPVITDVVATAEGTSTTAVGWTTNEAASSLVNYGATASYGFSVSSSTLATSHSLTLSGLTAGTTYHYEVQSTDAEGNVATSSDGTFYASGYVARGLTIPAAHPRIWWNSTLLDEAKTYAADNPSALPTLPSSPTFENWINLAWEHVVVGTDCTPAVDWAANTDQSSPVNGWPPPAGETATSGNGSDVMRADGEAAIIVYDWCNDQWSGAQKSAFISAMNSWMAGVDAQAFPGPSSVESNYFWGNLRNDLEWGIASYGDNGSGASSSADDFLAEGLNRWNTYKSDFASDAGGIPGEGTEYGSSNTNMDVPFQTANNEGLDLMSELNRPKATLFYLIYGSTPAPTYDPVDTVTAYQLFPYGDDEHFPDDGGIIHLRSYWQDHLQYMTNVLSGTGVGEYSRLLFDNWMADPGTKQPTDLMFAAQDANPGAASSFSTLPLDYADTYAQMAFVRTAWDTTSTVAQLQMGNGGFGTSHQHWDYGSFTLWRGGYFVDRPSSGYSNTIAGTPGIDGGATQDSTSQFSSNDLVFTNVAIGQDSYTLPDVTSGTPTIYRLSSEPSYFYADVNLTPVYLWDSDHATNDTGVVGHVEREFIYVRPLETLIVFDRILTEDQTTGGYLPAPDVVTTFVNHCETQPSVSDSTAFTCTDGDQVARQTVLLPSAPTARVINENTGAMATYDASGLVSTSTEDCSGCSTNGQYRIEVDNSGAAQRYDLDVIQSRAAASGNVTSDLVDSDPDDPASGTFTLTLTPSFGASTTIVLDKSACAFGEGECSTGGTINVGGAGAADLSTSVEAMAYSDTGPVWGSAPSSSSTTTSTSSSGSATVVVATGGGFLPAVSASTAPAPTSSAPAVSSLASLEVTLQELESELQALEAQAASQGISSSFAFMRDLELHDTGSDVRALQAFLIDAATGPSAYTLQRIGPTGYFGTLTFSALKEYQEAHDIHATGYFGSITRGEVEGE